MLPSRSATCSAVRSCAASVELGAALGGGEQLAGVGGGVRRADGDAEAGQLEVAPGARRAVDRPGATAASAGGATTPTTADRARRRTRRPPTRRSRRRIGVRRGSTQRRRQASTSTGTARSGRATTASCSASTRNARAPGIDSNSWIWRRSGTTSSCIVTMTAVGTSISPSHDADRNEPIAPPASRTIRQSWSDASSTAHGAQSAVRRAAGTAGWTGNVRTWAGVSRASAARPRSPRNERRSL